MKRLKQTVFALLVISALFLLASCSTEQDAGADSTTEISKDEGTKMGTVVSAESEEADMDAMKIMIDGTAYEVNLFDSVTKDEIHEMLPLDLTLTRYAGHEYYAELPKKPTMDSNTTSHILAGHIYYWDGWNAFVINFEDYDIAPYKVVHIGEITDEKVIDYLANAKDEISVKVEAK